MKLDNAHLGQVTAPVATPCYDRSKLTAGIIHLGIGGFHRGHQAKYLDALMNEDVRHPGHLARGV